jgi:uncharacterized glyoxalase superfamily metalloenzyme YdcJ
MSQLARERAFRLISDPSITAAKLRVFTSILLVELAERVVNAKYEIGYMSALSDLDELADQLEARQS